MRCVVQKVKRASVTVAGELVGEIGMGYMVLVGAEEGDTEVDVNYCADKISGLRVFEDADDKLNLSVKDVGGSVLLVSQFTLLGDARHGRRPSFSTAARPDVAVPMYEAYCQGLREKGVHVETGIFQADMKVSLINDGPVTLLLDSRRTF